MSADVNAFEKLSDIIELYEINEEMADEMVERALMKLVSILSKKDINPVNVARHIVECDALATYFALQGKYYMTLGKDEPNNTIKKNFYLTLREEFHVLANSLKFLVKAQP